MFFFFFLNYGSSLFALWFITGDYLIPRATLWSRYHIYYHFTEEKLTYRKVESWTWPRILNLNILLGCSDQHFQILLTNSQCSPDSKSVPHHTASLFLLISPAGPFSTAELLRVYQGQQEMMASWCSFLHSYINTTLLLKITFIFSCHKQVD